MDFIWWEKTVEYAFVQRHVEIEMAVAPLGGLQEKGGDAIFSDEENFVLIEFKRDRDCIASEQSKFEKGKFDEAKKTLENNSSHHLIIYGYEVDGALKLACQEYFLDKNIDIESALKKGIKEQDFLRYFHKFISYKKSKEGQSGGGITCVAGINAKGQVTKLLTETDFEHGLFCKTELEYQFSSSLQP